MRQRLSFWNGPPADAKRYKRLAWTITPGNVNGSVVLKVWRGKQRKPFLHYLLKDRARAERVLDETRQCEDASLELKAAQDAKRAADTAAMRERLEVGALLHYSWGYEQTQCEFFEVVERRGAYVMVREIAAETVPGSEYEHGMADMRRPVPGRYIGEPIKKLVGAYGLRMDHGSATPCEASGKFYRSWYH